MMSSSTSLPDDYEDIPFQIEDNCFAQTETPVYRDMGVFAGEMIQAQPLDMLGRKDAFQQADPSFSESNSIPCSLVSFSEFGKTNVVLEASVPASPVAVKLPCYFSSDVYPLESTHLKICTSDVSLLLTIVESFLKVNSNVISCDTCPSFSPFEQTNKAGTWKCHSFHENESCTAVIQLYEDKSEDNVQTVVVLEWQRRRGDVALFRSLFRKFQQYVLTDIITSDVIYSGPSATPAVRPSVTGVPLYRSQVLPCTMPDSYKVTHSPVSSPVTTTPEMPDNLHSFTQWIATEPNEALAAWSIFFFSAGPSSLLSIYTAVSLSLAHACMASNTSSDSISLAQDTDRTLCLALQCLSDMHTSMTSVSNVDVAAMRALQSKNYVLVGSLIELHQCSIVRSLAASVRNTIVQGLPTAQIDNLLA